MSLCSQSFALTVTT